MQDDPAPSLGPRQILPRPNPHEGGLADGPPSVAPATGTGTAVATEMQDLFPPPRVKASLLVRAMFGTIGVVLILLGVVLGVLPVVPGFPLVAVGIVFLVAAGESSRRMVNRGERHLPKFVRRLIRRAVRRDNGPSASRVP